MRSSWFDRQAWALLAPMLLIMAIVTGYPLVNTVKLAFTDARLTGRQSLVKWVGLENLGCVGDPARRPGSAPAQSPVRRPGDRAGVAGLAAGAAHHRQRHHVPADLQPRIWQLERPAAEARPAPRLSLLARRDRHGDEHGAPGRRLEELSAGDPDRAGGAADHPA